MQVPNPAIIKSPNQTPRKVSSLVATETAAAVPEAATELEAALEASVGREALEASVASKATFSLPLLRVTQFLRQAGLHAPC